VGFDLTPSPGNPPAQLWMGTYTSGGKIAKFKFELSAAKDIPDKNFPSLDIATGSGKFVSEPDSDASILLVHLKKALEAKSLPHRVHRLKELPFDYVILGKNNSLSSDGGFFAKPPGNWTAVKIFIGDGDQECEVFLNLNPVIGKGQFSIKDADYGNAVLASLAQVL
jgi:hypothetical protein